MLEKYSETALVDQFQLSASHTKLLQIPYKSIISDVSLCHIYAIGMFLGDSKWRRNELLLSLSLCLTG